MVMENKYGQMDQCNLKIVIILVMKASG
jgi:hypothetical protein